MNSRLVQVLVVVAIGGGLAQSALAAAKIDPWPPPSPYRILGVMTDGPPPIDVVAPCLPAGEMDGPEVPLGDASFSESDVEMTGDALEAALSPALPEADSPLGIACAELNLARIRLRAGFLPETRTHASRALRALGESDPSESLLRAARFYRAESLYQSGDLEEAEGLYVTLEEGAMAVARAARIRLADMAYVNHPDRAGLLHLASLLEQADEKGTDLSAWGPRLAEWSLRQDIPSALKWIERAPAGLDDAEAAALAVRRADLLYYSGESDEGRKILRELTDSGTSAPARQLAEVRLVDLERRLGDSARLQLERVATSDLPGLRAYARGVLARNHIATGDLRSALEMLVRLVHDGSEAHFVPKLNEMFGAVVAGLTDGATCDEIVATLGGRRNLLMRNVSMPEPFLLLGDCYLELGLGHAALDIYRGVTKVFGPTVIPQVTLRTARAEHRMGRLAPARAAARGSVDHNAEPNSEWRLLYGEILIDEGRPEEAVETLKPVLLRIVGDGDVGPAGHRSLLLSARAALRYAAPAELRELLRTALASSRDSSESSGWLAESALLVADLHRIAGDTDTARDLYGAAFASLEPGPLHSRSGYWYGVLVGNEGRAREIWSQLTSDDDPWAHLAANEIELSEGRAAVGARSGVPESRKLVAERGGSN